MLRQLVRSLHLCAYVAAMPLAAAVGISISPTTATLNQGATLQFSATVTGTTNTGVTWSVTGTGNGSITTSGLYTAPAKAGTFTVVVKSKADTTKTASATVTVSAVGISISPTTATVAQGGTQQFAATVTGTTNTAVTWAVAGTGNGSVSTSGKYTAPSKGGTFTVTVKSSADTTKTASATVTVPVKVSVSPAAPTVNQGATQQFTATVTGGSTSSVTWSASGGSITSGGLYTAPVTPGSYAVTATSVATPMGSGSATATVPGVGITISPTTASVAINGTKTFTATVTGSSNSAKTWSCSAGSITSGGVFTAPATAGTCTVTATCAADPTKTATATVTVSPVVTVTADVATVDQGATDAFYATVDGLADQAVTWTTSAGTITSGGVLTAPNAAGTVTVTATSVADPTAKATKAVTVRAVAITVTPKTVSVPSGTTQSFNATVTGTVNGGVTWTVVSGGGSLGNDSGTGSILYTAPFTTGTASLKATAAADATKTTTATITVTANPNPVILSFTATPTRIATGGSAQLLGNFGNGTGMVTPGNLPLTANTPRTVSPAGTTRYALTVTGTNGTTSQAATVNVTGPGRFLPVARTAPAMNIYDLMDARAVVDRAGRLLLVGASPSTADGLPVERFDPGTGTWSLVGRIQTNAALSGYTLVMLPDDRLLLLGGLYWTGPTTYYYSSAIFVFDTRTGVQAPGNWGFGRYLRDVGTTLLPDGRVLLAGGYGLPPGVTSCYGCEVVTKWAGILDPATGTTTALPDMALAHRSAKLLPLPDGRVLVADAAGLEVLDLQANAFTLLGTPSLQVSDAMLRADGKVLLKGSDGFNLHQFGLWDPATNQLQWDGGSFELGTGWCQPLPDGRALVGDWISAGTSVDPATFGVTTSPDATLADTYRAPVAAASLAGGQILALAGELVGPGPTDGQVTVKRFDPEAALTVAPAQSIQNVGLPVQLALSGPAAAGGVTWAASGGTITQAGVFTATQAGVVHVTATAAGGAVAHAWITAVPAVSVVFPTQPIPNYARAFHVGMAWPLRATVLNHANSALAWSLQEGATAGTITADGVYTAAAPGTWHVVATSVADPTKSATFAVTAVAPVALGLSPTSATLLPGQSATFTVSEPSGELGVQWSATGGTVTGGPGTGTYTAPATPGVYTVTARSVPDPTRQVTATVTVNAIDALFLAPARPVTAPGDLLRYRAYARSGASLVEVTASVAWTATGGAFADSFYRSLYTAPATPGTFTVTATLPGTGISAASMVTVLAADAFTTNGGGSTAARFQATLTRLLDGRVLLAGGGTQTAELYDPATKTFRDLAAPMLKSRSNHTATLLPSGKVLLAGGASDASAELFDPATESFAATAGLPSFVRAGGLATLLPNGKVLLAGGTDGYGGKSLELYDPALDAFVPAGALQSATPVASLLLADGRVLFSGSRVVLNGDYAPAPSETFDFRTTGTLPVGTSNTLHDYCSLVQAADGTVWRVGGLTPGNASAPSRVEAFDPATGQFSLGPVMLGPGRGATERVDGSIWFEGTVAAVRYGESTGMRFDPATGASEAFRGATLAAPTALLANGDILVAGSQGSTFRGEVIPGDPAPAVVVLPRRTALVAGRSKPFQASATGLGNTGFTWSVQEGVGSVSPQGVFTAPLAAGTYHVVATSTLNGAFAAVATVDVVQDVEVSIAPSLIQLRPSATQRFNASVVGAGNPAVTWSASGGSIAADGTYTAPAAVGTYTVTAASVANPEITATATVVVSSTGGSIPTPKITAFTADTTVVLAGAPVNLAWTVLGAYQQTLYADSSPQDVTGLAGFAPRPLTTTQYQLSATNPAGGATSAVLTVNVVQGPVSIGITPSAAQMFVGQTYQFGFSLSPTTRRVWSATGGTITQGGLYTAPATPGTYTVTVASVDDPTKTASAVVTVSAPEVSLNLQPTYASLAPGGARTFTATIQVTGSPDQGIVWSCTGGLLVPKGRYAYYAAPLVPGTYAVTAASSANPDVNLSATVVVTAAGASTPWLNAIPQGAILSAGQRIFLGSEYTVADPQTGLDWSADGGQLALESTGASACFTAPANPGTYTVSLRGRGAHAGLAAQGTITVTAAPPSPPPMAILPSAATLGLYQSMFLEALDSQGVPMTNATWTVQEANGGLVTAAGMYEAPGQAGTYHVTATDPADPARVATATITVASSGGGGGDGDPAPTDRGVTVAPDRAQIPAGTYQALSATVAGLDDQSVTWRIENSPADASIGSDGVFIASRPGTYRVVAASTVDATLNGSAVITVVSSVTPIATMPANMPVRGYSVTALQDGRILIAGGSNAAGVPTGTGRVYDPATGAFTEVSNALVGMAYHSAQLLDDGRVLLSGGFAPTQDPSGGISGPDYQWRQAAVYDPATNSFQALPVPTATTYTNPAFGQMRGSHPSGTAVRLGDGKILIVGDNYPTSVYNGHVITAYQRLRRSDVFDPATNTFDLGNWNAGSPDDPWTPTPDTFETFPGQTAVTLDDGRVLITGGHVPPVADPIDPCTGAVKQPYGETAGAYPYTACIRNDAKLYSASGLSPLPPMTSPRSYHTMTKLADGRVLIVGGFQSVTFDATPTVRDPATNLFDPHTKETTTATAEIFDPVSGTFIPTGSLHDARGAHAAALLPTGKVLVIGGEQANGDGNINLPVTIEEYDPETGRFTIVETMQTGISWPKLVLMSNHDLFISGLGLDTNSVGSSKLQGIQENNNSIGQQPKLATYKTLKFGLYASNAGCGAGSASKFALGLKFLSAFADHPVIQNSYFQPQIFNQLNASGVPFQILINHGYSLGFKQDYPYQVQIRDSDGNLVLTQRTAKLNPAYFGIATNPEDGGPDGLKYKLPIKFIDPDLGLIEMSEDIPFLPLPGPNSPIGISEIKADVIILGFCWSAKAYRQWQPIVKSVTKGRKPLILAFENAFNIDYLARLLGNIIAEKGDLNYSNIEIEFRSRVATYGLTNSGFTFFHQ